MNSREIELIEVEGVWQARQARAGRQRKPHSGVMRPLFDFVGLFARVILGLLAFIASAVPFVALELLLAPMDGAALVWLPWFIGLLVFLFWPRSKVSF
jgi:hypothetical protein